MTAWGYAVGETDYCPPTGIERPAPTTVLRNVRAGRLVCGQRILTHRTGTIALIISVRHKAGSVVVRTDRSTYVWPATARVQVIR